MKFKDFSRTYQGQNYIFQALSRRYLVLCKCFIAPPPAEASEIVQQGALDYSEFSQGVG